MARKRLGEIMVEAGWITEEQLAKALKFQQQNPCLIGEAIVKMHFSNEERVAMALSKQLGVPYASRENRILNPEKGQGLEKMMQERLLSRLLPPERPR